MSFQKKSHEIIPNAITITDDRAKDMKSSDERKREGDISLLCQQRQSTLVEGRITTLTHELGI